jgi:DNA repair exonuclease SbcCD ATPase subunit
MPEADQTIITKLVIDAVNAIESLESFDARLEETKKQLKEIAEIVQESFGNIGEQLKEAFEGEFIKSFTEQFGELGKLTEEARQKIEAFNAVVDEAVPFVIAKGGQSELEYLNQLRDITDDIKTRMIELGKESDDTFKGLNTAIKNVDLEKLNAELDKLRQKLKKPIGVSGDPEAGAGEKKLIEAQIRGVQRQITQLRAAASMALTEIKQEAQQLGFAFQPAVTGLQKLVQKGEELKQTKFAELMKPLENIVPEDEIEKVRQLAQELGSLEEAIQQQKPDIQITDQLREQLQGIEAEMEQVSQEVTQNIAQMDFEQLQPKIAAAEAQIKSLAQTTKQEFAEVAEQLKKTFRAETIAEFGGETEAASAKIKEYNQAVSGALKNITKETKQAKAAQTEYEQVTKRGYGEMSPLAQQYGQQVKKTAQIIQSTAQRAGQSWQQVTQRMARLGVPIRQINNALQQLNAQTKQTATGVGGLTSKVSSLGNVGKYVFGTVLGLSAITALRDIARGIKEAAEAALDFQQKMFAFEISVRALQRVGLETTLDEWYDVLQDIKKEFPIFSKRDITEAAGLAGLMTREFGFTTDQIENTIRASASLSLIWGKDLTESVRGLTYAISAGYFESLQRVGIQISRNVVAQEALRQGYSESYNALDEQIRAGITYDIVMSQVADLTEDTGKLMELQAGQVAALKSGWDDLTVAIGEFLLGLITGGSIEGLESLNKTLTDLSAILRILGDEAKKAAAIAGYLEILRQAAAGDFPGETFQERFEAGWEAIREMIQEVSKLEPTFEDVTGFLEEPIMIGGMEISADRYQDLIGATQEIHDEILEIEEDWLDKRQDLQDKFDRDGIRRRAAHDRKIEDLEADHQRRLDDIALKAQQNRDDAIADYGFRVAEVARNAAFRRSEAERKYRERELRDERKFQEKLRQLRENFLFDLEDAVRERDALQIIRLTRQYNLRRDQMVRDEKLSKDDRRNAFAEELRQIEFQRQERLRQLSIEHERRLAEIDLQEQREIAKANEEALRRQAAEEERWTIEQDERKDRYKQQLDDLDDATQDRVDKMVEGLQKELNLSKPELNALSDLYYETYGHNGRIPLAIQGTINKLQELRMMMAAVARERILFQIRGTITNPALREAALEYAGEQAEGGSIIARKPTVAIFGEAGDEMATFTPLNKLDRTSTFGGQSPVGSKDSLMGKLRLEMLLSPDLEARIIDDTLDEVAEVIYTVERERR